jgi:hypothetical protein
MRIGVTGTTLAAALLVPALALAQTQPRPAPAAPAARAAPKASQQRGPQVPPPQALLILIRSTMLAFDQANKTNVYHVFYGLGSDSFRSTNTPDKLAVSFAPFRTNNIDLSPVAIVTPQLARQPAIEQGRLHLVGFFPTDPVRINFDMLFEPSQNRWKMARMDVGLVRAQQQQGQQGQQPQQRQQAPAQRGQSQPQPRPSGR